MNCPEFREQISHFQADEVPEAERLQLQGHLDRCAECARRLELENALLDELRARLPRALAPPGLATRVRAALAAAQAESAPGRRGGAAWYRRPWPLATAAVVLSAMVVATWLVGPGRQASTAGVEAIRVVERPVLVVDMECDRAGQDLANQQSCRHPLHVNGLKLDDGSYWNVSLDDEASRDLVLTPDMRGRRLLVDGDLYPALHTLHLRRYRQLDSARLWRRPTPSGAVAPGFHPG